MNTGQSMLAIGAIILLSTVVLRVNNSFLTTNEIMMDSKFGVLGISLAQSVIEEASSKAFDSHSEGVAINDKSLLTPPDSLGNSDDDFPDYNDFDDYNGYTKDITNLPSAIFHISCIVGYVEAANPDAVVNHKTWNKRITVLVTSESSKDTVRLSSVFSYWHF